CQPMPRIPARWFNNSTTRTQHTEFFTILDHRRPNTILDTATRIEHLHLCQYNRRYISGNVVEMHKRRVPYQFEHGIVVVHFMDIHFLASLLSFHAPYSVLLALILFAIMRGCQLMSTVFGVKIAVTLRHTSHLVYDTTRRLYVGEHKTKAKGSVQGLG